MSHIEMIRELARQGKSYTEIGTIAQSDYRTVKKYIECSDFNEQIPCSTQRPSILDPYKTEIRDLLEENAQNWHKQRLTAIRIQMLLKERHPEYAASYPSLQRFVRVCKRQILLDKQIGFDRLIWHAGEAQADFGEADFIDADGEIRRYKYFVLSFPHANKAFCQIYLGENCECVCQALINLFSYLGGVPLIIVFDNAIGIGHRVSKELQEHRMFTNFRMHYRFTARFCNPYSGHEKGNVESNVGYIRRNMFVPLLEIPKDVEQFNRTELLQKCEQLMANRVHYIHNQPVNDLFTEDQKALLDLPAKPFIARRILKQQTNGYAELVLGKKHRYGLSAGYRNTTVLVETYPWTIKVYDAEGRYVEEFTRIYGDEPTNSINLKTCIANVVKKPNSWGNSLLREQLSGENSLKRYLDSLRDSKAIQKALYRFSDAMETFGYDTVMLAFQELIERNVDVTNEANVLACCNRVSTFDPHKSENATGVDLSKYAALMDDGSQVEGGGYENK